MSRTKSPPCMTVERILALDETSSRTSTSASKAGRPSRMSSYACAGDGWRSCIEPRKSAFESSRIMSLYRQAGSRVRSHPTSIVRQTGMTPRPSHLTAARGEYCRQMKAGSRDETSVRLDRSPTFDSASIIVSSKDRFSSQIQAEIVSTAVPTGPVSMGDFQLLSPWAGGDGWIFTQRFESFWKDGKMGRVEKRLGLTSHKSHSLVDRKAGRLD
ncbi:hypothetical protein QBC45DRAFT_140172 [Copromyces sp. CBS 386.78]|nr:hypothetical protein QBC45DRAFT_140172 [Copromyces sp. CBS 386.78]